MSITENYKQPEPDREGVTIAFDEDETLILRAVAQLVDGYPDGTFATLRRTLDDLGYTVDEAARKYWVSGGITARFRWDV